MTRERYRGALLGLAAGDALGTSLEQFAKRQDVPLLLPFVALTESHA
ncbi:MAG: hypothetical protein WBZ19_05565 [Chthoniobacterales bacterium]